MILSFKNNVRVYLCLAAAIALTAFQFSDIGLDTASANNTAQTLPFTQNWTNVDLITTNDDWSGVPGIVGYRGDDIVTGFDTDLRTILADGSGTPIDVNANRADPDTFATGGITEFDGIPNPVVAIQGSGTSDVPHLVLYLNTTGQSGITVSYNARDIDNGTDIDAVQQINTQFRVGGTGDYDNVTGGYIADASAPGGATLVTPVNVTLPASADNQALVEVRIMTTNALGSDEFIGIDDISVTSGGTPPANPRNKRADFDGDGKSDISVFRPDGGNWFVQGSTSGFTAFPFGASTDKIVPGDYDGDGRTDYAVFRPSNGTWYVNGTTGGFTAFPFGASTDIPVPGYYDSDNKTDIAVFRPSNGTWYIQGSTAGYSAVTFGLSTDRPVQGDYDGDGRTDVAVFRPSEGNWFINGTTSGFTALNFGLGSDKNVQSDFDGDGRTDIAVFRPSNGTWYIQGSTAGYSGFAFGLGNDIPVPADYDGDGKADIAVFRPEGGNWYVQGSTSGFTASQFGVSTDIPVPNSYILNE